MQMGERLRDFPSPSLNYGDLYVLITQSPQDSAIARSVDPEASQWDLTSQLLAMATDYLAWLQWAKTEDGAKGRRMPKRIPRPGVEPDEDKRTFGSDPVPIGELEDFLGWAQQRIEQVKERPPQPRDLVTGRFIKR